MDASKRCCFTLTVISLMCIFDVGTEFYASKPMGKTWWAKRITESLFIAGRLSDIQIKYASEDGFKSVISVYNHTEPGRFGSKELVTTAEAADIAERLSGLEFEVLFHDESHNEDQVDDAKWRSIDAIRRFDELYRSVPKPVMLYSNTGYSAAYVALSWLVWQTHLGNIDDTNYQISVQDFYERASGLGYNFSEDDDLKHILEELGGGQGVQHPTKPDLTLPDWHKHYWWAKPVEKNWYIAGQIWSEHLDLIKKLGADIIVNSRMGTTGYDPESGDIYESQEEVTLLNVNEDCWTYCPGGRQSTKQLLANRIDADKLGEYIGQDNSEDVNYMARNPLEFGDDIGYNETMEQHQVENIPMEYIHTPLENCDEMKYKLYNKTWMVANGKGNVLMHCRTGCRAVVPTLLTLGVVLEKDVNWAIDKAKLIGYDFSKIEDSDTWDLFQSVFESHKSKAKTEL